MTNPKNPSPEKHKPEDDAPVEGSEMETEEDKIKREQATKPALMPIGDPAGAA
ncbi:MAG TPA: hypothetical protein VGN93_27690 [Shinella sp.]|jgi:hypothetical protein|uniref:hypothetical protein n=1 Tax=Shinella sp. TaxID=1870904 RepID=UPI0029A9E7D2|nr:hypothetical protein [Shinella sp.]MDX3975540.1 hypothetical protein [Shinella sp.]HEV7250777.1 hypothetical protein [Shinella sp.]